jgi:hypothetical protein
MNMSSIRSLVRKIIYQLDEDYRFEYKQEHTPTDIMSQTVTKAKEAMSKNNLISKHKESSGKIVTGERRSQKIINKEPLNHNEVRALRDLFVSLEQKYKGEKSAGKTIQNSAIIQMWELNGGDAAKNWVNNILGTHHTKSLNHKDNRRGHGDVGIVKNMMKPRLAKKQNLKINKK